MNIIRYASLWGLLLAISSESYAEDSLSIVFAKITQAYNVDYQQKDIQKKLQFKDQIEKERLAIERNIASCRKSAEYWFNVTHTR